MTIDLGFFLLGVFLGWSLVKVYYWGRTVWKEGELGFHLEGIELVRKWIAEEQKIVEARITYSEILIEMLDKKNEALTSIVDQVDFHIDFPLHDYSDHEQRMFELADDIETFQLESKRLSALIEERGEYSGHPSNL